MSELKINRLVLIGNGFDLAHGLKTSFYDFINYCTSELIKFIYKLIEKGYLIDKDPKDKGKMIISKVRNFSSSYEFTEYTLRQLFDQSAENLDILSDFDKYMIIIKKYNFDIKEEDITNPFPKLFSNELFNILVVNSLSESWAGIEKDFYDALLNSSSIKSNSLYSEVENIETLNSQFKDIINCLEQYLLNIEISNTDIKLDLLSHLQNISSNEVMIKALSKINQINKFDLYNDVQVHKSESLEIDKTLFLNFNYTNLIEKYFSKEKSNKYMHIQIHGDLRNNCNPIIFGYGDEKDSSFQELENKNDNRYLKYAKSLHYLSNSNYKKLLTFLEQGLYQVFIWGHSCATSDRVLLQTIFEHENCISIKPFFYKLSNGTDNFTDLCTNISRSFTDKKKFRDVVVNKEYCVPLSL